MIKRLWIPRTIEIIALLAQIVLLGIYIRQALVVGGGLDRSMLVQVMFPVFILPVIGVLILVFIISQFLFRDRLGLWTGCFEVLFLAGVYLVSLDLHVTRMLAFSMMVAFLTAGTAFILLVRASVR